MCEDLGLSPMSVLVCWLTYFYFKIIHGRVG